MSLIVKFSAATPRPYEPGQAPGRRDERPVAAFGVPPDPSRLELLLPGVGQIWLGAASWGAKMRDNCYHLSWATRS